VAGVQDPVDSGHIAVDTAAVSRAWEAALRAPAWEEPPVWIHADITPGNLLVAGGRLSAVIDEALGGRRPPVGARAWLGGVGALVASPYYHNSNPALAANSLRVIHQVLSEEPVF
jgi:hypothetical protein